MPHPDPQILITVVAETLCLWQIVEADSKLATKMQKDYFKRQQMEDEAANAHRLHRKNKRPLRKAPDESESETVNLK